MRRLAWLGLLLAGCRSTDVTTREDADRWVPVETAASNLAYSAGDGVVRAESRVVVLVPSPAPPPGRRPAPKLSIPARVQVGEGFRIEIRIPRAGDRDTRTLRIRPGRPGLRLLDGDRVVLNGRGSAIVRAVADSPGPASFDLEEIGN